MQYQKEEIRAKILDSAKKEFFKVGYYRASVIHIATESKVTIGNLYRYFINKEELFASIVKDAYENIPKILLQYYQTVEGGVATNVLESDTIYQQIATVILQIDAEYGNELILLVEKSEGSKFCSFGQALKESIVKMFQTVIFHKQTEEDRIIAEIITSSFLAGVFNILHNAQSGEKEAQMLKLIRFYFYNANKRFLEA